MCVKLYKEKPGLLSEKSTWVLLLARQNKLYWFLGDTLLECFMDLLINWNNDGSRIIGE